MNRLVFRSYFSRILLVILMAGVVLVGAFSARPALAATGINKTLNLQGRLLTNTGAIVADGNYNFRVRIYQDGDGVLGGGDETLKWTELWQNAVASGSSAPVVVKNGYFSINLGSFCVFAGGSCQGTTNTGVDFNQTILWASLDIGGTSVGTSPTYDGEMTPFRRLSSAVYALQAENANTLGGLSSSGFIQNTTTVQSGANIYVRSAATGSVVSVLEGANGQTADLLDFNTFNGTTSTTVAKFTAAGNLQVAASIDTVTGTSLAVGGTNATSLVLGKNSGTTSTTVQSGSGGYSVTSTGNGSVTANGSVTITAGGGSTWSTSAGNLIVQAGGTDELRLQTGGAGIVALGDQNSTTVRIGRGSNIARTIDIGTAGTSTTQTISIGSTGGASVLNLKSGSGGILINDSVNSPVSINTGSSTGALSLGNASAPLSVIGNGASTSTVNVGLRVAADSNDRFQIRSDGGLLWGPGNAATDITLSRTAAQVLTVNQSFVAAGNLTAGSGSIAGVAKLSVQPAAAGTTGAVIRGASGVTQTASLLELQEGLSGSNYVNAFFSATGNQLTLGRIAATGTNTQGKLVLADGTNDNFGLTVQSSTLTASRTYSFPDSPGNTTDTICLLTLSNCSTGTLQGAYGNDVDGSDAIISLTTADDSLIFRNPAASGTDSTYVLTVDQLATGAKGGIDIQSAGTGNLLRVRDTTATAADVFTIADGGNATFQSQTNSTSAFVIQNAAGAQAIKVDTTADSGNLVTNGSFEVNTSGWAGRGTGSVSRITSSSFSGVGAMSVTTSAANDGAKYNLTLAVSTQYTINFMAQAVGAGFSTMNYGYSVDGTNETDCKTAQNPVTTGFKIFTCTFTTTATAPSGTPYIYIKQTDGTGRTFYIDAFQIRVGSSAGVYRETAMTVSSAVTSAFGIQPTIDSSLAFNVESADGSTLIAVDSVNKRFGIGTQAPSAYLHVARTTSNDATVMARINTTSTQSGDLLQFFDDSASAVLSKFGADADLTIKAQADMSGALQVQNAAGTTTALNVDTSAGTTTINGGAGGSTTALIVNSNATTNAGLLVKGVASQSEDLFNIRNSSNTKLFSVKSDGATFIGTDPGGTNTLAIRNGSFAGTNVGLLIQAHGSQSVNLLQLQDSSANINGAFNATGNQLTLGRVAASGTVTQGKLVLADGTTDNFGLTVQSATLTASRTYSFPDSPGNTTDTICLLTLANCSGSATTLQNTYAADADGSDAVIALTTADDSIILRNPSSGGSDSTYILTLDQLATGARGGLSVQSAGTGNLLLLTDTTATARDVLTVADGGATTFRNQTNSTTAFQIQNSSAASLFAVDSTNSRVAILSNGSRELTWVTEANTLPGAVQDGAAVAYGSFIYVLGGSDGTNALDTVYYARVAADGTVGTWQSGASLTVPRYGASATVVDGHIVVVGGTNTAGPVIHSNLEAAKINADGSLGAWISSGSVALNTIPTQLADAFTHGDTVYTVGGTNSSSVATTATGLVRFEREGFPSGYGAQGSQIPAAALRSAVTVWNGYVYVVGGYTSGGSTAKTAIYYAPLLSDGSVGSWSTATNALPNARGGLGVGVIDGYLYAYGGDSSGVSAAVYFAPLTATGDVGTWTTAASAMPNGRKFVSDVVVNGRLYSLGGSNGTTAQTSVYRTESAGVKTGSRFTADSGFVANGTSLFNVSGGSNQGFTIQNASTGSVMLRARPEADSIDVSNLMPARRAKFGDALASGVVEETLVRSSVDIYDTHVAFGGDGYQRITYDDATGIRYLTCTSTPECVPTSTTQVVSNGFVAFSNLAVGDDDFGRIAYMDNKTSSVNFVQCTNASCSTKTSTSITATAGYGSVGLTMAADSFARMTYMDTSGNLRFVQCTNDSCSTKTVTTVVTSTAAGDTSALKMGSDGFARIVYTDTSTGQVSYIQCTNASCSTRNTTALYNFTYVSQGVQVSIGVDSSDFARIAILDPQIGWIRYIQCTNATCATRNETILDGASSTSGVRIVLDGGDVASIVYNDRSRVMIAQCTEDTCTNPKRIRLSSAVYNSGGFGSHIDAAVSSGAIVSVVFRDANSNLRHVYVEPAAADLALSGSTIGSQLDPFAEVHAVQGNFVGSVRIAQEASQPATELLGVYSQGRDLLTLTNASLDVNTQFRVRASNSDLLIDAQDYVLTVGNTVAQTTALRMVTQSQALTSSVQAATQDSDLASDGFARILYNDDTNVDARYIQCTNLTCSTRNDTAVETTGNIGLQPKMVVASDTFGRLLYLDTDNALLRFAQCTNASCSTKNLNSIDTSAEVGTYSLAMGSDGFGRVIYNQYTSALTRFIQCTNASCSTRTTTTIESVDSSQQDLAMATDTFARLAYYDLANDRLRFIQCTNASCSTNTKTTVITASGAGSARVRMAADGFARIVYVSEANITYIQCTNASCSANNQTPVYTGGTLFTLDFGFRLGSDGFGRIVRTDPTTGIHHLVTCTNASCSTSSDAILEPNLYSVTSPSLMLSSTDVPMLVYPGSNNASLYTDIYLTIGSPTTVSKASLGSSVDKFGSVTAVAGELEQARIQSSTNSTTALLVQNTSSVNIFAVDTTNARVVVGPTAGSTTGTILVLGNKTSFGDPTGVAGAVYYNSNTNSFRCYTTSGFWQPCMQSTIPGLGIRKWGFMAPNRAGSASMNGTGYMSVPTEQSNTAAASNVQSEDRYITYDTGTTSGTEAGPIFRSGVTRETYRNRMTARIRMSADITSQRIWFGLFSTDPTGFDSSGAAKYVALRYSTGASDTAWQCASSDGTTASVTSTGVTVTADHYYDLVIDWTSSGVLQCQVSDNGAGFSTTQKSTNIVTSDTTSLGYNLNLTNLAAANRAVNISFITFESN